MRPADDRTIGPVNLIAALALLAAYPLLVLVHELGHAVAALRLTSGPVHVQVGAARPAVTLTWGRLSIVMSPVGLGGSCRFVRAPLSRRDHIVVAVAGPAVNIALAGALAPAAAAAGGGLAAGLWATVGISALMGIGNLIPRHGTNTGLPSDGLLAWSLLRRRGVPAPGPPRPQRAWGTGPVTGPEPAAVLLGIPIAALTLVGHVVTLAAVAPWLVAAWLLGLQSRLGTRSQRPRGGRLPRGPSTRHGRRASSAARHVATTSWPPRSAAGATTPSSSPAGPPAANAPAYAPA